MLDAHIVKARRTVAVDVRLKPESGGRLGLFGASGAGKSTLLSCLAGIEVPDAGEIRFGETVLFPPSLPLHRRPLAYLTQNDWLFPHLSVGENVSFGVDRTQSAPLRKWIEEIKTRLELGAIWKDPARQISGGQARRVALARMIARRPPLVLLDEPFTALDRPTTSDLIETLLEWHRELGFTLIAVEHRAEILDRLCPRVAVIESGQVVQDGQWASIVEAPATPLLKSLLSAND